MARVSRQKHEITREIFAKAHNPGGTSGSQYSAVGKGTGVEYGLSAYQADFSITELAVNEIIKSGQDER